MKETQREKEKREKKNRNRFAKKKKKRQRCKSWVLKISFLAIPMLTGRKTVQKEGFGPKCGFSLKNWSTAKRLRKIDQPDWRSAGCNTWTGRFWEFVYCHLKVFRYSFSQTIPMFFNRLKSDFILVRSLQTFHQ